MRNHPYANAFIAPIYAPRAVTSANARFQYPDSDVTPPNSGSTAEFPKEAREPPPVRRTGPAIGVSHKFQPKRRPSGTFVHGERSTGITLTLRGQSDNARRPVYGRGARVDGTITFADPSNVLRVEATLEGNVSVRELAGHGKARTVVLEEELTFWDAPSDLNGEKVLEHLDPFTEPWTPPPSSTLAPSFPGFGPGSGAVCPATLPFSTNLPTHFFDTDGTRTPLPPSYSAGLASIPGFKCDVTYTIRVVVILRSRTALERAKVMGRRGRTVTLRVAFVYVPRTRPSRRGPFSPNTGANTAKPVTLFTGKVAARHAEGRGLRSKLYIPHAQVTALSAPIPFLLTLAGSEDALHSFRGAAPLPSFLPMTPSSSAVSFASLQESFAAYSPADSLTALANILPCVRAAREARLRAGTTTSGHSRSASTVSDSSANSTDSTTSGERRPTLRVQLVRQVSVDARAATESSYEAIRDCENSDEFGATFSNGKTKERSHICKSTVIGEGLLYAVSPTTRSSSNVAGKAAWAGEVHVEPRAGVRCGGFKTSTMAVKDMLIVSITGTSQLQDFRQVIPIQLTTDVFGKEETGED